MSIWKWIQRFGSYTIYKRKRVSAFIIDETVIQIGNQHFWLWICIEPNLSFSAWNLHIWGKKYAYCWKIYSVTSRENGKHTVYTDGGTWYDEAYNILRLKHYLHSSLEKSLIERVNQYFKDRIECFDDYYSCRQNECNLFHVHNWIQFFVSIYNGTTFENYFINELNSRGE